MVARSRVGGGWNGIRRGAVVAVLATLTAASGADATTDRCRDEGFALRCPGLCAPLCDERQYFLKHQAFCLSDAGFLTDVRDPGPGCGEESPEPPAHLPPAPPVTLPVPKPPPAPGPQTPKDTVTAPAVPGGEAGRLAHCLQETEQSARPLEAKLAEFKTQPKLVDTVREKLKDMPTCAADSPSLMRMFRCLEEEGRRIDADFGVLAQRGYTKMADASELCKIGAEDMSTDFILAEGLRLSATELQKEFERINDCKNAFEAWGNTASQACAERACGRVWQAWIDKTRKDLEPTAAMASTLGETIKNITEQTTSIIDAIGGGVFMCDR